MTENLTTIRTTVGLSISMQSLVHGHACLYLGITPDLRLFWGENVASHLVLRGLPHHSSIDAAGGVLVPNEITVKLVFFDGIIDCFITASTLPDLIGSHKFIRFNYWLQRFLNFLWFSTIHLHCLMYPLSTILPSWDATIVLVFGRVLHAKSAYWLGVFVEAAFSAAAD